MVQEVEEIRHMRIAIYRGCAFYEYERKHWSLLVSIILIWLNFLCMRMNCDNVWGLAGATTNKHCYLLPMHRIFALHRWSWIYIHFQPVPWAAYMGSTMGSMGLVSLGIADMLVGLLADCWVPMQHTVPHSSLCIGAFRKLFRNLWPGNNPWSVQHGQIHIVAVMLRWWSKVFLNLYAAHLVCLVSLLYAHCMYTYMTSCVLLLA